MNRVLLTCILSLISILYSSGNALASPQEFIIINNTGHNICALYIAPSNTNDWQDNLLEQAILGIADQATFPFHRNEPATFWDVRVVYENGFSDNWKRCQLRKQLFVTLKPDANT
jgi:hypothetical protein